MRSLQGVCSGGIGGGASMDVRELVESAFKELLRDKPYGKITVSEICRMAGVTRKAFYSVFRDKEAVVEALFDEHVVNRLRNLHRLFSLQDRMTLNDTFVVRMYEAIYAEKDYYINLVGPLRGHDDTFLRVVTNSIYKFNMDDTSILDVIQSERKRDYVAYFFASSQAMLMQKWISDRMDIGPDVLAEIYNDLTMPFLLTLLDRR